MTALRTALAARKHDLPPRWDGIRVDWGPWEVITGSWRFHLPLDSLACRECGSLAEPARCVGAVTEAPGGVYTLHRRLLHVARCVDCGHDTVLDLESDESWDLDPSDYGDQGSYDPKDTQGTLF